MNERALLDLITRLPADKRAALSKLLAPPPEPLAIIGLGCRLPGGVRGPDALWRLLQEGRDGVIEVPPQRWDWTAWAGEQAGQAGRWGGFLDAVDRFDPEHFGIAPREAAAMDPQHRLLLEVLFEALEHAGLPTDALAGQKAGVYIGIYGADYASLQRDLGQADAYSATGNGGSFAAGRLAYLLDIRGPAVAVDTVCSSSLVALHLAAQDLRQGRADLAIVGGVNLMLSPLSTYVTARLQALSPTGRCRPFDARADGFVRGEGVGVVLLARQRDAARAGHRQLALLRGTAVNQDGRAAGLTAPNGRAQVALMRAALKDAGVDPAEVAMLEAHGTGTPLGDPIELEAIAEVYGPGERPLALGSVKSNLGHLEAAAGVAGLLKATLALERGEIPAQLHFHTLNPAAKLPDRLRIARRAAPWPEGPRLAALSSFGMSGTNAHALLEAAPPEEPRAAPAPGPRLLLLSAGAEETLEQHARQVADALDALPEDRWPDAVFTAARGRRHLGRRLALVAEGPAEAAARLREGRFSQGQAEDPPRLAYLFTGQGAGAPGQGRALAQAWPVFAEAIARCDAVIGAAWGAVGSTLDWDAARLAQTRFAQPALFALQTGLFALLEHLGLAPAALIGHSVGEVAAAVAAGVMDLEPALRWLLARAAAMQDRALPGAMLSLPLGEVEAEALIAGTGLEIAALNGESETVVSGPRAEVLALRERLAAEGQAPRLLRVSTGFHSACLDPCLPAVEAALRGLALRPPRIPLVCGLTGALETEAFTRPETWLASARRPVRFAAGLAALAEAGVDAFLELGPHPVLAGLAARAAPNAAVSASLVRDRPEARTLLEALGGLHCRGVRMDLARVVGEGRRISLPTTPLRRERYWQGQLPEAPGHASPWYALRWRPVPAAPPPAEGRSGWLVLAATRRAGEAVAAALAGLARPVIVACAEPGPAQEGRAWRRIRLDDIVELQAVLASPALGPRPGLLHAVGLEPDGAEPLEAAQRRLLGSALALARAAGPEARLWLLGQGVWSVAGEAPPGAQAAGLWGLGAVIAAERPALRCQRLDLDPAAPWAALAAALAGEDAETELAWRAGQRYAARLVRLPPPPPPPPLRPEACYLITGGLGGVGGQLAAALIARGARRLLLLGRRPRAPEMEPTLAALAAAGAEARYAAVDVADEAALAAVLADAAPIAGVFHAAAVVRPALLDQVDSDGLWAALAPKLAGARSLARLLPDLDFLVLFSSISGLLGAAGEAGYAAANRAIEGLAGALRAEGRPATALAFGPWDGPGLAGPGARWRAIGLEPLAPAAGLAALAAAPGAGQPALLFAELRLPALAAAWGRSAPPLLAGLLPAEAPQAAAPVPTAPPADLPRLVRETAARVLGARPERLHDRRPLQEQGLDSLMAVQLARALSAALGEDLPVTLVYDQPSLRQLSDWLAARRQPAAAAAAPDAREAEEDIAIIGLACRFPGSASDEERLWRLLMDGVDAVREVPADRWDLAAWYDPDPEAPDRMYVREGGFLDRIDGFDPEVFGISPREAAAMDPQQRLWLHLVWEGLERAGLAPDQMAQARAAVYCGIGATDYQSLSAAVPGRLNDPYLATGNALSVAAGRASYTLGLVGPALAVDTACSSALVAVHLAVAALRAGEADLALAGGVSLMIAPEITVSLCKLRALSPSGRCRGFDAEADGYIRGEGGGLVVLKRLGEAIRDGDPLIAVIRGSAINHDGRSNGLTAPSAPAQEALIRAALRRARLSPEEVGYVEAHGTGTPLGDPIELSALRAVYQPSEARPLWLGSVKSNLGHLESAAGIAGLIKAALAVQRGWLPPHLHWRAPNPHASLDGFQLPAAPTPWPQAPRRAEVSAFGFSGTNAAVVLEQAPAPPAAAPALLPPLLCLSASDEASLSALAGRWADRLEGVEAADCADLCYTALRGRARLPCRVALTGEAPALIQQLRALAQAGRAGQIAAPAPRLGFLFSGQGAQYAGMGRALYGSNPAFRAEIDACAAAVADLDLPPLAGLITGAQELDDTALAQPALVAMALGLAAALAEWGVEPDAVLGHSVGEIPAAVIAGLWSREQGLRLAVQRGALMGALPPGGGMTAINVGEAEARALLRALPEGAALDLAAINGPGDTVLSGPRPALAALATLAADRGLRARPLAVSHAFHSAQMDPILAPLRAALEPMQPGTPRRPMLCNLTGALAEPAALQDPARWVAAARAPVRFGEAVAAMAALGIDALVELGPRPRLLSLADRAAPGAFSALIPAARPDTGLEAALAALFEAGARLSWPARDAGRRRVAAPLTPLREDRYWLDLGGAKEPAPLPAPVAPARLSHAGRAQRAELLELVQREVGAVLGWPADRRPDLRRGFFELGMDSLMAVALRRRLEARLGAPLPPTLTFDQPNTAALASFLARQLDAVGAEPRRARDPDEPLAIVGLACRMPGGGNDPEAWWRRLAEGYNGVREVPPERWDVDALYDPDPDAVGKMYTRRLGLLEGVGLDLFDAAFFGISPREAVTMDPQQRLLLEVAWEALERAGQPAERLSGSPTGVFVGVTLSDYAALVHASGLGGIDPYAGTGTTFNVLAGRLSFVLGLQGPNLPVDTACSSSLVAVHLAAKALRDGECDLAVAGGVNLILSPAADVYYSRLRATAPDGRCKSFDAAADGFVRGEGVGVVVIRRLSDALAAGDRIWALIRGTAVNHDGRSSGLTVPNGSAQQAVLRRALAASGLAPADLDYVETHGTGTSLGDPIEAGALIAALGPGRTPDRPLVLGAVKSNIGHLEASAGVAGLIKATLALHHELIPPNLHFHSLNPNIQPGDVPLRVPTEPLPWPRGERPRRAGVSSFGISGTNAHVVLEEAPPPPPLPALEGPLEGWRQGPLLIPLSARSAAALEDQAHAWRRWLEREAVDLADLAWTAAVRRSHHPHRLAVRADSVAELRARLGAWADGERPEGVQIGRAEEGVEPRLVFVFPGQGGQHPGMTRQLLAAAPAFRQSMEACDAEVRDLAGFSIFDLLMSDNHDWMEQISRLQPVFCSIQISLAALWRSLGVDPDAVIGHSLGEVAAAWTAGGLGLRDALTVICVRSALFERLRGAGELLMTGLSEEDALALAAELGGAVDVAAVNGPASALLAGPTAALAEAEARLRSRNVFARRLGGTVPSHSAAVEPLLGELVAGLAGVVAHRPTLPFWSTVTGGPLGDTPLDAAYWAQNMRQPVRFYPTAAALVAAGHRHFLELGPHMALSASLENILREQGEAGLAVPSLQRGRPDLHALLDALGALHTQGYAVPWAALYPGGRLLDLPAYPWQRRRFWVAPAEGASPSLAVSGLSRAGAAAAPWSQRRREARPRLADWTYALTWREAPLTATQPRRATGRWLILGEGDPLDAALARGLRAAGAEVQHLHTGAIQPEDPEAFDAALADPAGPPAGLIFASALGWRGPEDPLARLEAATAHLLGGLLHLVQALIRAPGAAPLWVLTRGAQPVDDGGLGPDGEATGPLWGLGRVVALEQPERWGGLIDLDPAAALTEGSAEETAAAVLAQILAGDGEDQVAWRGGQRRVARLVRAEAPELPAEPIRLPADGTCLLTGGLGSVGLSLASWLVDRGARHLLITSRAGLPAPAQWPALQDDPHLGPRISALRALEARGASVRVLAADAASPEAMRAVIAGCSPPVKVAVHAAGVTVRTSLQDTALAELRAVMAPKQSGAALIRALAPDLELLVLFSSAASAWGSAFASAYAAANHALDLAAVQARAAGMRALAVSWGGWGSGGMISEEAEHYFTAIGLGLMEHSQALEALEALISGDAAHRIVSPVDWSVFKPVYEARRARPLLAEMTVARARGEGGLKAALAAAPAAERGGLLRRGICEAVAAVLRLDDPGDVDLRTGFFQLGLDSLLAVRLRDQLGRSLDLELPVAVLFEHASVEALARHLLDGLLSFAEEPEAAPAPAPPTPVPAPAEEDEDLMAALAAELDALAAIGEEAP